MSSKTKIVVLRMKEIIYTAIFLGVALFLITICIIMFRPGKAAGSPTAGAALYTPGVYTSALPLGNETVNLEVTVNSDRITSIALVPLSEAVATMYPLMQPSMEELSAQIIRSQSTQGLTYPSTSRYTSQALVNAIDTALDKARLPEEAAS